MCFSLGSLFLDVATPFQLGLQDACSSFGEEVSFFHDRLVFYQIIILSVVFWLLFKTLALAPATALSHKYHTEGLALEIIWTIVPAIVLIILSFPSFKLLYLMDAVIEPALTIKAIGRQWFWSYEYSDYDSDLEFDSYMIPTDELLPGDFRLLEVDNPMVVPIHTHIRVLITAGDVIHSWAVPALGVKLDAIPGRLNGTSILLKREGLFYGQCSELCGAQHGFMPIVVKGVSLNEYLTWINNV